MKLFCLERIFSYQNYSRMGISVYSLLLFYQWVALLFLEIFLNTLGKYLKFVLHPQNFENGSRYLGVLASTLKKPWDNHWWAVINFFHFSAVIYFICFKFRISIPGYIQGHLYMRQRFQRILHILQIFRSWRSCFRHLILDWISGEKNKMSETPSVCRHQLHEHK